MAADSFATVDVRAFHERDAIEIRDAVLGMEPLTPGAVGGRSDGNTTSLYAATIDMV